MKKKTHKDFEKWALPILLRLQKLLLLNDFHPLKISYKEDGRSAARCILFYPYKSIEIEYGDSVFKDWTTGDIERCKNTLTHEMCHPITDELYCKATERWASKTEVEDARERLTDHIANIILTNNLI